MELISTNADRSLPMDVQLSALPSVASIGDSLPLPTRIAFVGNYLTRQCGIATFTTDLCNALGTEFGSVTMTGHSALGVGRPSTPFYNEGNPPGRSVRSQDVLR